MTDKKEVSILLLGIVAILAIVGLVLLFTSPAATGRNVWELPPLPPQPQYAAPSDYAVGGQYDVVRGGGGNAIYVLELTPASLPACPNGRLRTQLQGNVPYEAIPGYYCDWFACPGASDVEPLLACAPIPSP